MENSLPTMSFLAFLKNIEKNEFVKDILLLTGNIVSTSNQCNECLIGEVKLYNRKDAPILLERKCSNGMCRKKSSIFKHEWFVNKNMNTMLTIMAYFVNNNTVASCIRDTAYNEKTVYSYFKFFRELTQIRLDNDNLMLGGVDVEVEIDETHLFTRKYNQGSILASQAVWLFGIIERDSKLCYVEKVENRNAQTLYNIVATRVRPESVIYSDCWRGYSLIDRNFSVLKVNHKLNFVDPVNRSIHTNNIERLWRSLKERMRGVSIENYEIHLDEFMFRKKFFCSFFGANMICFLQLFSD